jgi:hypothetical protein
MLKLFPSLGLYKQQRALKKYKNICKLSIKILKLKRGGSEKKFYYNPKSMETTRTSNLP